MNKDEGPADLLVEAIGEFRAELIEWIDFQLDGLCNSEAWLVGGAGARTGAMTSGQALARTPENLSVNASAGDPRAPSPATKPTEGAESSPPIDTRHRFDAVARRLGERLKLSEESQKGTEQRDKDKDKDKDKRAEDRRRPGR